MHAITLITCIHVYMHAITLRLRPDVHQRFFERLSMLTYILTTYYRERGLYGKILNPDLGRQQRALRQN